MESITELPVEKQDIESAPAPAPVTDIYSNEYIIITTSPNGSLNVRLLDVFIGAYTSLISPSLLEECKYPEMDTPLCFTKAVSLTSYLEEHMMNQLPYRASVKLFEDITSQISSLEEKSGKVPSFIDMKDIYVLYSDKPEYDDNVHLQFIFVNGGRLCDISKDTSMIMNTVSHMDDEAKFASPEYRNITSFPSPVHKNSWMYSIGLILCKCLRGVYKKSREVIPEMDTVTMEVARSQFIDNIELTPLYYAIQRCLRERPEKRKYLLL